MSESGRLHRGITRRVGKWLHPFWPGRITDIVFIVGCPRSGTSVFGQLLSQYPDFLYMHEPRYIWRHVNTKLNVWRGHDMHGRLYWDAEDIDRRERQLLEKWFHLALTLSGQRRLVEKLPLNVFRVHWLAAMFPEAKFIHVVRHARDVALSMQEAVEKWFSQDRGYPEGYWESSWHYHMFEDHAKGVPELAEKLELVRAQSNNYARCLFVWLCSVWEGYQAGQDIGGERQLRVRYEDLVRDPVNELSRVFEFLQEPIDQRTIAHAHRVLHADSLTKPDPDQEVTKAIAGTMLTEVGYEV
jgi:hypothetical protein